MKLLDRRKFIYIGSLGVSVLAMDPFISACNSLSSNKKLSASKNFNADLDIELNAVERDIPLFPGKRTKVWRFESKLISGDAESLQQINNSYLGPLIRVKKGQKVRVRFTNLLSELSIVHFHGMHVPELYDGHPKYAIPSSGTYIYEFEIMNKAGTYWYHPHPHTRTGPQVYYGLAGMLVVTDEEEQRLNLPSGEFDIPIIIQDRTFDADNQLVYNTGGMMGNMIGFLGDQIMINGLVDQSISVAAGTYRFRLLNGSNSRFYKLAWADGTPLTVIGTDGSLLDKPLIKAYIILGVAERIDLCVDFSNKPVGSELLLKSMPFTASMQNMGMMGSMQTSLPLGSEYSILNIKVEKDGGKHYALPEKLVELNKNDPAKAINYNQPRTFKLFMDRMRWTIDGRTFEMQASTDHETVKLNTTEIWEFINNSMVAGNGMMGNGMMQMSHPIHLHQVQFNILERNIDEMDQKVWSSVKDGFVDEGWKDTVLVMPCMKIKILMAFKDFKGLFLYHCHNLEHEDMGMMRNYKIV